MIIFDYLWIAILGFVVITHLAKIIYTLSDKKLLSKYERILSLENSKIHLTTYYVLTIYIMVKLIIMTVDKIESVQ